MRIIIGAKQLDLTPSVKTYIENKLGSLEKFIKPLVEADSAELAVELSRLTRHHRHGDVFGVFVNMRVGKKNIRAEAKAGDIREAVDMAKNKLKIELERSKERRVAVRRIGARRK